MELKIDELISDIDDNQVVIVTIDLASVKRIKELTLDKINSTNSWPVAYRRRPRSMGILVAVLITFLATVVMATTLPYTIHTTVCEYPVSDDGQIIPEDKPDWGVEFSTCNVSPTGMELTCTHTDGNYSGQLMAGDHYYLERRTDSGWEEVPKKNDEYVWRWVNKEISRNSTYTWTLDWSAIYGELSPGTYRLYKPVWELQGKHISQTFEYCIEFVVGGDA